MSIIFTLLFLFNMSWASDSNKCSNAFSNQNQSSLQSIFTKKDSFPSHHAGFLSFLKNNLSKKETDKSMEKLYLRFLEVYKKRESKKEFKYINKSFEKAYKQIPNIYKFLQEKNSISIEQANNNKVIFEAVLVTFLKHIPMYLDPHISNKDWGRINKILNTIAEFDPKKGNYSLYKIKRAIEGRYSLKEYILCRM